MRKLLTFVAAICCTMFFSVSGVKAAELADKAVIRIGTTQITADNQDDVKDDVLTSGKIYYDAGKHELTLENAQISANSIGDAGIYIESDQTGADITINVIGECQIQTWYVPGLWLAKAPAGKGLVITAGKKKSSIRVWTYDGSGSPMGAVICREGYDKTDEDTYFPLTITGGVSADIDNSFADDGAAFTCHHLVLIGAGLHVYSSDLAGPFDDIKVPTSNVLEKVFVKEDDTHKRTYDFYTKEYPVWVNGVRLNDNKYSVSYSDGISGTISYDEETRTLSFSSASVSYKSGDATIVIEDTEDSSTPVVMTFSGTSGQINGGSTTPALLSRTPVIMHPDYWAYTFKAAATAFKHESTVTIANGGTIKFESTGSGNYGIEGDGSDAKLIIEATNVWAKGEEACIYEPAHELKGVKISSPLTAEWADDEPSPKDGSDIVKGKYIKFEQSEFTVSAEADPKDAGTVVMQKEDGGDWVDISNPYKFDGSSTSIRISAMPNEGYIFAYWDNDEYSTDPVRSTSISSDNETFVAHFMRDFNTTTPLYVIDYDKKIRPIAANLRDGLSSEIATIPATDLKAATFYDGNVYYLDYDGLKGEVSVYAAEFTPEESTKLGSSVEIVAPTSGYLEFAGLVYSEKTGTFYTIGYDNLKGKRVLCGFNLTDKKFFTVSEGIDLLYSNVLAADASGELYTIQQFSSDYWLVRINLTEDNTEKVAKLPVSMIGEAALVYDQGVGRFILYNNDMAGKFYVIDASKGDVQWVGNEYIMAPKGMFAFVEPKPKYEIEVKVADGQGSYGKVTPEGKKKYPEGTKITITATSNKGYLFDKWSDGGEQTHEITVGTEDKTYTASFKKNPDFTVYEVFVGEEQFCTDKLTMTKENNSAIKNTGFVTFDPATNTLSLNAVEIESTTVGIKIGSTDEAMDVTIIVNGTCNVKSDPSYNGMLIYGKKLVTIKGGTDNPKLTVEDEVSVNGANLEINALTAEIKGTDYSLTGDASNKLIVNGSALTVKGASVATIGSWEAVEYHYCDVATSAILDDEKAIRLNDDDEVADNLKKAWTKDIQFTSWPALRIESVEEGSGTYELTTEGGDEFQNVGWFGNETEVTVTAKPADGYEFAYWTDDSDWKDPKARMGARRTFTTGKSDQTLKAMFYYKPQSDATWYGVNNGKFISFSMEDHGAKVAKASTPGAGKVKAGDYMPYADNNVWVYLDNTKVKAMEIDSIADGKAIDETKIVDLISSTSEAVTDIAYDFKAGLMYAVVGELLYVADYEEEKLVEVGKFTLDKTVHSMIAIAIDGKGNMYVLEAGNPGTLYRVTDMNEDEKEVTLELVGETGSVEAEVTSEQQSMAFDHVTGELFWGAKDYLRIISTTDAKSHICGALEWAKDGNQGVIKSLHRKDRQVTVRARVADGQEERGSARVGESGGSAKMFVGAKATIKATAKDGYKFSYWTDSNDDKIKEESYSFTVRRSVTYTAHFTQATGLEEVQEDAAAAGESRKVLVDGVLYIVREGRIYDMTGRLVR